MEDTRKELDQLRQRKTDKAEFARLISQAGQIKDLIHSMMNLSFAGKQRLLHGVLDGPVAVGLATLIPHCDLETEDALMEILKHTAIASKPFREIGRANAASASTSSGGSVSSGMKMARTMQRSLTIIEEGDHHAKRHASHSSR